MELEFIVLFGTLETVKRISGIPRVPCSVVEAINCKLKQSSARVEHVTG